MMAFVRNHASGILAYDFFITRKASLRVLYVFMILEVGARGIADLNSRLIPQRVAPFSRFVKSSREQNLRSTSRNKCKPPTVLGGLHHEYRLEKVAA
jgi:hypothetical protein